MSDYIVSARKYRPMTFSSVVGQTAIASTLKNAIQAGKLAHAFLFCGPRGVGKTTCARIFAKTINCLTPTSDGEACGECESCRAFNEGRSLNIHELDAASNNSVDDIRELIDQVRVPPQIGRYKVFIIDEVHMLSTSAFNAFLKTLEEPPAHAIFILATTEKHKILPTILSRCQVYDFQRMTVDDIMRHLASVATAEGYSYEPAALNVIAQKADGGMRDALSIFDQVVSYTGGNLTYQGVIENLNVLDYDYYFRLVDHMLKQEVSDALLLLADVLGKGFDGGAFISGLAHHLRDLLVSRDAQTTKLLEASDDIRQRYAEQAQRCKPQWLYRAIKICNDCDQAYRTSRNRRLQIELAIIECAQATDDDPAAGRRPSRRILKPIFSRLASSVRHEQSQAPKPAHQAPHSYSPTSTAQQHSPVVRETAKLKTLSLASLSPSIRTSHSTGKQSAQSVAANTGVQPRTDAAGSAATPPEVHAQPVTQERMMTQWHMFANSLPQAETALAQRMRGMRPSLANGGTQASLVVDNEEVAAMIERIKPRLLQAMRTGLDNSLFDISVSVADATQPTPHTYDKHEQMRHLCEENPALATLSQLFQCELM